MGEKERKSWVKQGNIDKEKGKKKGRQREKKE